MFDFDRKNDEPRRLFLDEMAGAIVKVVASHGDDDQGDDNQHWSTLILGRKHEDFSDLSIRADACILQASARWKSTRQSERRKSRMACFWDAVNALNLFTTALASEPGEAWAWIA
jgi:hypothetical protein